MISIEEIKNNNLVKSLFKKHQPNNSALWSYLNGDVNGRTFVDDPVSPKKAICMISWTWAWVSDDADIEWTENAIQEICKNTWLNVIWNTPERAEKPAAGLEVAIPRQEFIGIKNQVLPFATPNVTFKAIDADLFDKCLWQDQRVLAYGSKEKFLEKAFGFCAMEGNQMCSESCASFVANDFAEMGAITAENKRRQGFGLSTCATVIQEALKRGLTPTWSCDTSNFESVNLAKKLGFNEPVDYEILYFPQK